MKRTNFSILLLLLFLTSCAPSVSNEGFYETRAVAEILVNKPIDIDQYKSLLVTHGYLPSGKNFEYFEEIISYKDLQREIKESGIGNSLSEETAKLYFKNKRPFLYIRTIFIRGYRKVSFQVELVNPENSEIVFSARSSGGQTFYALRNELIRYISEHSDIFQIKEAQNIPPIPSPNPL